ncbi:Sugar transport protein [Quillaja saponaria]|uniref:Sugar transport protein n=1 Tax=Quillaja saponaria TaxID=32244 RepID=A0AAD7LM06_QUISA|nr:Sugar transport protein [Quillaja saponaria]
MAGGPIAPSGGKHFPAKLTSQVIICSIIAAFGGLMFGYDIGISGGVTSMDDFLIKFFHEVYIKKHKAHENNYCKYNNEFLQLFTSSLYLAAIVASFVASIVSKYYGRRPTIKAASIFFVIGAILNFFAKDLAMLIFGRMFLGAGVGFGNQAVPLFISEIAPAKYRGALNILFQLLITVGILIANIINYKTAEIHPYGWRISLGGAAIPAIILLLGSFIIVETPASLIERGKEEQGRKTLKKIRGVEDVEEEFQEIVLATQFAKKNKDSYRTLMKRTSRPQLICGTIFHLFQQFTGINVVMFYAPVLFQTMGFGGSASLLSAVITGVVNATATLLAIFTVDKVGRRLLLIEGALQMITAQVIIGIILGEHLKTTNNMSIGYAKFVVVMVCIYVSGFAWSWGPLGWLYSSEIYPLETRNAGFFCAVSMNMFCTFLIAQLFLTMLCSMRSATFYFFVAWLVTMLLYTIFMLPETKGIPIDEMVQRVWKKHWFWKKYYKDTDCYVGKGEEELQVKTEEIM